MKINNKGTINGKTYKFNKAIVFSLLMFMTFISTYLNYQFNIETKSVKKLEGNDNNTISICDDYDKNNTKEMKYSCEEGYELNKNTKNCTKVNYEYLGKKECPDNGKIISSIKQSSGHWELKCLYTKPSIPSCDNGYTPTMDKNGVAICAKCKSEYKTVKATTKKSTTTKSTTTKKDTTAIETTTRVEDITDCDSGVYNLLRKYWKIIMIFSPVILILMTTLDFFKAIISSDSDKLKKASSDALKRTLAYVILVLLPFIISTIFSWVGVEFCL